MNKKARIWRSAPAKWRKGTDLEPSSVSMLKACEDCELTEGEVWITNPHHRLR